MEEQKKWNGKEAFRGILLVGFHLYFLWLIVSGESSRYLSTHMSPFLYFATATFLLLAIVQFKKCRVPIQEGVCDDQCGHSHHAPPRSPLKKFGSYGLLTLPLLLGILIPYQVPGSALAAKKGAQIGLTSNNPFSIQSSNKADFTLRKQANDLMKQDKIQLNESNYLLVLSVLNQFPDQFIGKRIQINGMVFVDPTSPYKGKAVGRMVITCCFADSTFYGIPIESGNLNQYKQDTWISIQGTLDKMTVNGEKITYIKTGTTEAIPVPQNPYIFPSL